MKKPKLSSFEMATTPANVTSGVGCLIKAARLAAGKSVEDIASASGLAPNTIYKIERLSTEEIELRTAAKLYKILGIAALVDSPTTVMPTETCNYQQLLIEWNKIIESLPESKRRTIQTSIRFSFAD